MVATSGYLAARRPATVAADWPEFFSSRTRTVFCSSGESNVAVVVGPEGSHLDLYVYDGFGQLVIAAMGYTTWACATW